MLSRLRLAALSCLIGVGLLALAMRAGVLAGIDRTLLLAAAPADGMATIAAGVTWFGDSPTRTIVAAVAALWLAWRIGWRHGLRLVAVVAGGAGVNSAIKAIVQRPRPALLPHLDAVTSFSFPSGHAANSMILYLSLALLMPERHRPLAVATATLLVIAIGVSRVILAVHWPSDVVAGWLLGIGWICLWNQSPSRRSAG